jgi:hypothetical protein
MIEKEDRNKKRNGNVEILGIESRAWRDISKPKKGWGGYHSPLRRILHWIGFLLFVSVWIFLVVSFVKGRG